MANTVYNSVVLGTKITDILKTSVDLSQYMTVDTSLVENPGMVKKVNVYTATGDVEVLEMGAGNTKDIAVGFTTKDYTVKTTQGRFKYFDEQAMNDPAVVEVGLKGLAATMVNDFTKLAVEEFKKATLTENYAANQLGFDDVVDAIAKINSEDESGLFLLISVADKAAIRKTLKDDLKYSEDYVRTGYIGTVAGVPVIVSKAVPEGEAYLASKDAVTLFLKKDTEVEQEREANTRENIIYARKYAVVALTDATKAVKFVVG